MFLPSSPERGQGLTEYSFILLLVVLIVILVIVLIGPPVGNMFSNVVSGFQ